MAASRAENPRSQCRQNLQVINPPSATLKSVSSRRNRPRSARGHKPLTRALLLPMDRASANKQSLANHLALVACRSGHGNGHLINELMRAVYLGLVPAASRVWRHPGRAVQDHRIRRRGDAGRCSRVWRVAASGRGDRRLRGASCPLRRATRECAAARSTRGGAEAQGVSGRQRPFPIPVSA